MKRIFFAMLVAAAIFVTPTGAHAADPPPPPPDANTVSTTLALRRDIALPNGTSAPFYCKRVTVTHRHGSGVFNSTVYVWQVWTDFCYNGIQTAYASTGQQVSQLASTTDWQGVIGSSSYYTGYQQTFYNMKQAKWCANAPLYGCISYGYPVIQITVNKSGGYSWSVQGNE